MSTATHALLPSVAAAADEAHDLAATALNTLTSASDVSAINWTAFLSKLQSFWSNHGTTVLTLLSALLTKEPDPRSSPPTR